MIIRSGGSKAWRNNNPGNMIYSQRGFAVRLGAIENVLYYKHKDAREKDIKDIFLIEQWMRMQKS